MIRVLELERDPKHPLAPEPEPEQHREQGEVQGGGNGVFMCPMEPKSYNRGGAINIG